jgi:DNA-binding MarR family transcriptional regulator
MSGTASPRDRDVRTLAWLARLLESAQQELSLAQYRLLALLDDGDEQASRIAGRLALTRPTVSATIDTLVERGLVERGVVDGDRRAVRLTLTDAGELALHTAERTMRERLDIVLSYTGDRDAVSASLADLATAFAASRDELMRNAQASSEPRVDQARVAR